MSVSVGPRHYEAMRDAKILASEMGPSRAEVAARVLFIMAGAAALALGLIGFAARPAAADLHSVYLKNPSAITQGALAR